MTNFKLDIDADGIALVTWDMPGRSMNVIDTSVMTEIAAIIDKVDGDGYIKGAVVTSAKDTFCAGADLTMLETLARLSKNGRLQMTPETQRILQAHAPIALPPAPVAVAAQQGRRRTLACSECRGDRSYPRHWR